MTLDKLIERLHSGKHSLVMSNGDDIRTFDGRGVSDLYNLHMTDRQFMTGANCADKIVGKGAAAIMILGQLSQVYADVISQPALDMLRDNNVEVSFGSCVPNIINRQGTGICPVEALCADVSTPSDCLPLITKFLASIKK